MLWGGAQVANQYLGAGLLNELELHVVPVLLGDGARLFDNLRNAEIELEQVRAVEALFVLTDFEGLEPAAWFDDVKTGLGLGLGHHSAWKRSAIVTNVDWIGKAYRMFARITTGEVQVYELDQLARAKNWVAA